MTEQSVCKFMDALSATVFVVVSVLVLTVSAVVVAASGYLLYHNMTLRDYFAMRAQATSITTPQPNHPGENQP